MLQQAHLNEWQAVCRPRALARRSVAAGDPATRDRALRDSKRKTEIALALAVQPLDCCCLCKCVDRWHQLLANEVR
jgi:hypothetical protein